MFTDYNYGVLGFEKPNFQAQPWLGWQVEKIANRKRINLVCDFLVHFIGFIYFPETLLTLLAPDPASNRFQRLQFPLQKLPPLFPS